MKKILVDIVEVMVSRMAHDHVFQNILKLIEKLRKLVGIELYENYNRKMMVTIN